jgi:hypothetical protein
MSVELNVNKKMIRQIFHEDLQEEDVPKIRPTETHGRAEATETHIRPRLHPDLSRQSQFS